MHELSIDYSSLTGAAQPVALGRALLDAIGERYTARHLTSALTEFEQGGATYLFDFASSRALPQEDRTVAAWATTPPAVATRDAAYQRGFPLPPRASGAAVDRGHLIPHLSGGAFGPNIFRQDRALNRGWSSEGRRYRSLEREAARTPGVFFFGHLIYTDDSADPRWLELGLLRGTSLHVERFDNQPSSRES